MPLTPNYSRITPEEAREVWFSIRNPNPSKVARIIKNATGIGVDDKTIAKFRKDKWVEKHPERNDALRDGALETVDNAVAAVTGDPRVRLRDLIPREEIRVVPLGEDDGSREKYLRMIDEELFRESARYCALAHLLISNEVFRVLPMLTETEPDQAARLITALGALAQTAKITADSLRKHDAGTVQGEAYNSETDPLLATRAAPGP